MDSASESVSFYPTSAQEAKRRLNEERRKHLRFSYVWPLRFCQLNTSSPLALQLGKCKNLSQGGLKINALTPLERRAVAVVDLDLNPLSVSIRTDGILLIANRRILVEVAWRHLNLETGLFEAGLRFIEIDRKREFETLIGRAVAIS